MKKTVVIGASSNPERYSYLAVDRLTQHEHPVIAIGSRAGQIGSVPIITTHPAENDIDTVTLYVNPSIQTTLYDYIFSLHPKRIIFNPGTENPELCKLAKEKGIQCVKACTLVLLSTHQY
ncbi:CoA-binding protein [Hydrotalea sp.]|uniref:CoA-binding protein n=1 Tax=Hydrotalea sp. TaxID=2881279 RepID=UPI00261E2295|nr:CoA-binding protein [Hydrotalea sp.]